MRRMTVPPLFYALVLLPTGAMCQAAWLPRMDVVRRQAGLPSAIPSQCSSVCTPALMALQACTPATASCLCAPSLQGGLFSCFSCAGQAGNTTDYSVPQMQIDEITVACDQAGMPLPKRTFPGQNPNRTLATSTNVPRPASTPGPTTPPTAVPSVTSMVPPASTQTAPTTPLSIETPVNSAISASNTVSPMSTPTSSTRNGTNKRHSPMWMVTSGVLLVTRFLK